MVASSLGHVLPNSHSQLAKIASLQPLGLPSQRYAMRPANLLSCTSARAMFVSVLLLPNVFRVFVTQFQSVLH
jgi:hypothetical protein